MAQKMWQVPNCPALLLSILVVHVCAVIKTVCVIILMPDFIIKQRVPIMKSIADLRE